MNDIVVMGYTIMGFTEKLEGIPTPALVEAGQGEAYFVPNPATLSRALIPGVWYLRDDAHGYVSPDGKYRRVRVVMERSEY